MTIKNFNINLALNGASIGFISVDEVTQYIIDFRYSNEKRADKEFVGVGLDDSIEYYFNKNGECSDGNSAHKLYRIEGKITFTTGTAASRGEAEGAELISIESMLPRELFALTALQSILSRIEEPILGIDDFKIEKICDLSFKIAQKMLTTAAECRAASKENEDTDIEIDINTVTSSTDKILYNINNNLIKIAEYYKVISENSNTTKEDVTSIKDSISSIKDDSSVNKETFTSIKESVTSIKEDSSVNKETFISIKDSVEAISTDTRAIDLLTDIANGIEDINTAGVTVNNTSVPISGTVGVSGTVSTYESRDNFDVKVTNNPTVGLYEPIWVEVTNTPSVSISDQPIKVVTQGGSSTPEE